MFKSIFAATLLIASPPAAEETSSLGEAPSNGSIVIYRGASVMGAAVACPVRHEGREIVELGRGKFAKWDVAPGRYILTNKTASVEVSVASGETRFVRCQIKTGFMTGRADLHIVDDESFEAAKPNLEHKEIAAP